MYICAANNNKNMENNLLILTSFCAAVLLGAIIMPHILIISYRKRLFDMPNERKIHHNPVPRLGGVTFFPVILCVASIFIATRLKFNVIPDDDISTNLIIEFFYMTAGLTLLYIVGIADDLIGVRYRKKFLVQFFSASLFPISGLYINNLYGLFNIYEISASLGIALTILLVVFITNAINLIDGIDGLASGLSMIALVFFGSIFYYHDLWIHALLAFITIGVVIPFFMYNVFGNAQKGRKIFMGDTGSLTLGYIVSFFVVKYCMYYSTPLSDNTISPVLVSFSILMVPCLDVIRVVMRRARNKEALFMPDKTHIHHKFMQMGFTPHQALISILCMAIAFSVFTIVGILYIDQTLVFLIDIATWTVLNVWFDLIIAKRKKMAKQS